MGNPKKEERSELEEQKIARSYFDTKIQHAQLVSMPIMLAMVLEREKKKGRSKTKKSIVTQYTISVGDGKSERSC